MPSRQKFFSKNKILGIEKHNHKIIRTNHLNLDPNKGI